MDFLPLLSIDRLDCHTRTKEKSFGSKILLSDRARACVKFMQMPPNCFIVYLLMLFPFVYFAHVANDTFEK